MQPSFNVTRSLVRPSTLILNSYNPFSNTSTYQNNVFYEKENYTVKKGETEFKIKAGEMPEATFQDLTKKYGISTIKTLRSGIPCNLLIQESVDTLERFKKDSTVNAITVSFTHDLKKSPTHTEGFGIALLNDKLYVVPFSPENNVKHYLKEEGLVQYLSEKLNIPTKNIEIIHNGNEDSLQSDAISCHTIAFECSKKALKRPEEFKKYVVDLIKLRESNPEHSNYFLPYLEMTQSLKRISKEEQGMVKTKYMAINGEKTMNLKAQLKTIKYCTEGGKDLIKEIKSTKHDFEI